MTFNGRLTLFKNNPSKSVLTSVQHNEANQLNCFSLLHKRKPAMAPSLEKTLNEFRANVAENMPADMLEMLQAAIDKLVANKIASNALTLGQKFPHFDLPNAAGKSVSLTNLLAKGPIIVNFYRGSWCPYCNFELQAFQKLLPEIHAIGGELVAISPQLPDNSLDTIEKNKLLFPVLSDTNNLLADQLGIRFDFDPQLKSLYEQLKIDLGALHGSNEWQLPVPATYVVNCNSTIALASIEADYTTRLEPAKALLALKSLLN